MQRPCRSQFRRAAPAQLFSSQLVSPRHLRRSPVCTVHKHGENVLMQILQPEMNFEINTEMQRQKTNQRHCLTTLSHHHPSTRSGADIFSQFSRSMCRQHFSGPCSGRN